MSKKVFGLLAMGVLLGGCGVNRSMDGGKIEEMTAVEQAQSEVKETMEAVEAVEEADNTMEAVDVTLDSLDEGFEEVEIPESSELSDQALEL